MHITTRRRSSFGVTALQGPAPRTHLRWRGGRLHSHPRGSSLLLKPDLRRLHGALPRAGRAWKQAGPRRARVETAEAPARIGAAAAHAEDGGDAARTPRRSPAGAQLACSHLFQNNIIISIYDDDNGSTIIIMTGDAQRRKLFTARRKKRNGPRGAPAVGGKRVRKRSSFLKKASQWARRAFYLVGFREAACCALTRPAVLLGTDTTRIR